MRAAGPRISSGGLLFQRLLRRIFFPRAHKVKGEVRSMSERKDRRVVFIPRPETPVPPETVAEQLLSAMARREKP